MWTDYYLFFVLLFSFLSFLTIWTLLNPVYTVLTIWLGVIISLISISAIFVTNDRLHSFSAITNILSKDTYIFVFLCIITVLPRLIYSSLIYSLPISGDEREYVELARLIANNGLSSYFARVRTRILLHPPLFVIFLSAFFYVFGSNYHISRLLMIILSPIPVFITFLIGKDLFEQKIGLSSAILFSCFPYYFFLSLFTSIDMFLIVFYVASIYFYIRFINGEKTRDLIFLVIITSLGLLVKYSMVFIYPTLLLALVLEKNTKLLKNWKVWIGGALPLLVLCCWLGVLWHKGILISALMYIFKHFSYEKSGIQPSYSVLEFLGYFVLGLGFISAIISLSGMGFYLRGIIQNNALLFTWSLIPILFWLYIYRLCRFLIPVFPTFAILCAMTIIRLVKERNIKLSMFLLCILSSITILSIWTFAGLYLVGNRFYYYIRF